MPRPAMGSTRVFWSSKKYGFYIHQIFRDCRGGQRLAARETLG